MTLFRALDLDLEKCGHTHVGQTATLMLNPHIRKYMRRKNRKELSQTTLLVVDNVDS